MPDEKHVRPNWDEYFMEIVHTVAKRGNCDRGRTAALIVKDRHIIATGYVGAPAGLPTCDEVGHLMKTSYDERGGQKQNCVRTTHAEANALAQAAKFGTAVEGATIYCFMEPCLDCVKLMINAGIRRVLAERRYHAGHDSRAMLADAGVKLEVLNEETVKYTNQN